MRLGVDGCRRLEPEETQEISGLAATMGRISALLRCNAGQELANKCKNIEEDVRVSGRK